MERIKVIILVVLHCYEQTSTGLFFSSQRIGVLAIIKRAVSTFQE